MLSINKEKQKKGKFTAINFERKFTFAFKTACMKSFCWVKFFARNIYCEGEIVKFVLICLLLSHINQFLDVKMLFDFEENLSMKSMRNDSEGNRMF